jgi:hypothetical protein
VKAEAARADQGGAEHFRRVAGEFAGKSAADFLPAKQRTDEGIVERRVLIGDEFALPSSLIAAALIPAASPDAVAADRPEIGTAAQELAIPQDENAAVATSYAVEHMDVDGVKPVPH